MGPVDVLEVLHEAEERDCLQGLSETHLVSLRKEERSYYLHGRVSWKVNWGSVSYKHIVRWHYSSQIKVTLFWLDESIFFQLKMLQDKSSTSAATYDLMKPHS